MSPSPLSPIRFSSWSCLSLFQVCDSPPHEGPRAGGEASLQQQTECATHTPARVRCSVCVCAHKGSGISLFSTVTSFSFLPIVTRKCFLNFTDKERRALTAHTLLKDREPPLLLAWFKSCLLIKLFRTCSWHFNTPFYFESDYSF